MKNVVKTSYFFLSFLFFCSITPLENAQSITNTIKSYLQCLEPKNPLILRTVSSLHIPFIMYNFAFDEQGLGYNKVLSGNNDVNDIDKKLFCSFPFISLTIQTVNVLYPGSPFKIFSNFMMLKATDNFFHFLNQISPNTDDQSCTINLLKSICSLSWPFIAHYNNPDLFAIYTYLTLPNIIFEHPSALLLCLPLFAYAKIKNSPQTVTLPIPAIDLIFSAKQTMFLVAVILACFNVKLKNNNILTNPAYWLSIGMAHLLFAGYRFRTVENYNLLYSNAEVFSCKTRSFFGIIDTTSYKSSALHYMCFNAIPITAVLISAAVPI